MPAPKTGSSRKRTTVTRHYPELAAENPRFLSEQLITYLGNKRQLLGQVEAAVLEVKERLGKDTLVCFDAFSGSGVVSRLFKRHASHVISNDLEAYAARIGRCYLSNACDVDLDRISQIVADFNARVDSEDMEVGFLEELYAPRDEDAITADDRVFYTRKNARRLDRYRRMIEDTPADLHDYLLAPLMSRASVHANTSGVFKGFYKNSAGIGQFGGTGRNSLGRILGDIVMDVPVLSRHRSSFEMIQGDANETARSIGPVDFAYFDPPYNQHPYGSNYFMLNLLDRYQRPEKISRVSGIPADWNRSPYNKKAHALAAMSDLVASTQARFIAVSFNNEGFISTQEMTTMLSEHGPVSLVEIPYAVFRGSRNLAARSTKVVEQLFLLDRR